MQLKFLSSFFFMFMTILQKLITVQAAQLSINLVGQFSCTVIPVLLMKIYVYTQLRITPQFILDRCVKSLFQAVFVCTLLSQFTVQIISDINNTFTIVADITATLGLWISCRKIYAQQGLIRWSYVLEYLVVNRIVIKQVLFKWFKLRCVHGPNKLVNFIIYNISLHYDIQF